MWTKNKDIGRAASYERASMPACQQDVGYSRPNIVWTVAGRPRSKFYRI